MRALAVLALTLAGCASAPPEPRTRGPLIPPPLMSASSVDVEGTPLTTVLNGKANTQNPCSVIDTTCKTVADANSDGNLTADIQSALNALLWPSGTLTAASDVYLYAPPAGVYTLTDEIKICGDTSPPSGSTAPDCTGTSQQLPRIHLFAGDWSGVELKADFASIMASTNRVYGVFSIGDALADATSGGIGVTVPVTGDERGPLIHIDTAAPGVTTRGVAAVFCNGCSDGELHYRVKSSIGGASPGHGAWAAYIAGPRMHFDIESVPNGTEWPDAIMVDGDVRRSSVTLRGGYAYGVHMGSISSVASGGAADGCAFGAWAGNKCDGFAFTPETHFETWRVPITALQFRNLTLDGFMGQMEQNPSADPAHGIFASSTAIDDASVTQGPLTIRGSSYCINHQNTCYRINHPSVVNFGASVVYRPQQPVGTPYTLVPGSTPFDGEQGAIGGIPEAKVYLSSGASFDGQGHLIPDYLQDQLVGTGQGITVFSGSETTVSRVFNLSSITGLPRCLDFTTNAVATNCTTNPINKFSVGARPVLLTRLSVSNIADMTGTFTANACHVRLYEINTATGTRRALASTGVDDNGNVFEPAAGASLDYGSAPLRDQGEAMSYNVNDVIAAGQAIQIELAAPATNFCQAGTACACTVFQGTISFSFTELPEQNNTP